jgi:hypothetical protein
VKKFQLTNIEKEEIEEGKLEDLEDVDDDG